MSKDESFSHTDALTFRALPSLNSLSARILVFFCVICFHVRSVRHDGVFCILFWVLRDPDFFASAPLQPMLSMSVTLQRVAVYGCFQKEVTDPDVATFQFRHEVLTIPCLLLYQPTRLISWHLKTVSCF